MSHSGKTQMEPENVEQIHRNKPSNFRGGSMSSKPRGVDLWKFPGKTTSRVLLHDVWKIGNLREKWCPRWILWGCKIAQSIAVSFLTLFRLSSFIITECGWQHKSLSNKCVWRNEEMLIRNSIHPLVCTFENLIPEMDWNGTYRPPKCIHAINGSTGFNSSNGLSGSELKCVKSKQNCLTDFLVVFDVWYRYCSVAF